MQKFFENSSKLKKSAKKHFRGGCGDSLFFLFFFHFWTFFHLWDFFGISRKSRDFSIPWDFFGIFIPDFLRKSHGIFFPWDWDFFRGMGNPTKSHFCSLKKNSYAYALTRTNTVKNLNPKSENRKFQS